MWKGINGVLIAKLRKMANHKIFWLSKLISANEIICKSEVPTLYMITKKANSINSEPNSVYINSKKLARIRDSLIPDGFTAPQIPTIRNNGIRTDSKNT